MPLALDLHNTVFIKTPAGQAEIQTRALGLPPMVRRILVLVDGHRKGKDLAAFTNGADITPILEQLLETGCVAAENNGKPLAADTAEAPSVAQPEVVSAPAVTPDKVETATDEFLLSLPDPSMRSSADGEMARNFMINTVNTVFGQNMRLTLIQTIFEAQGTAGLRLAYLKWAESLAASRIGEKRLPELRAKLAKVL